MSKKNNVRSSQLLSPFGVGQIVNFPKELYADLFKEKNNIDNLVLFDREVKVAAQKALQKSIEKTVEKENYEWITMQVSEDGSVEYK